MGALRRHLDAHADRRARRWQELTPEQRADENLRDDADLRSSRHLIVVIPLVLAGWWGLGIAQGFATGPAGPPRPVLLGLMIVVSLLGGSLWRDAIQDRSRLRERERRRAAARQRRDHLAPRVGQKPIGYAAPGSALPVSSKSALALRSRHELGF